MPLDDGEILKAVVPIEMDDGTVTNQVFHWIANVTSEVNNGSLLTLVGQFLDALYTYIDDLIADSCVFLPYYLTRITWDDVAGAWQMAEYIGEVSSNVTPADVNEALPNQMAATVRATTPRPRSYGRKFIPGFTEGHQDGGILSGTATTALANFVADYIDDIDLGAVGALSPGVPRTNEEVFLDFITGVVNDVMGTQRKRKPGVGS